MKSDRTQHVDLAGRLKSLEDLTRTHARPQADADAIPVDDAPGRRVPVPRRSRIFLRHGEGHGTFADLTIIAPRPRSARD